MPKLFKQTETGRRYIEAEDSEVLRAAVQVMIRHNLPDVVWASFDGMATLMEAQEKDAMRLVKDREKEAQVNP
jgi:hypothetical protein